MCLFDGPSLLFTQRLQAMLVSTDAEIRHRTNKNKRRVLVRHNSLPNERTASSSIPGGSAFSLLR